MKRDTTFSRNSGGSSGCQSPALAALVLVCASLVGAEPALTGDSAPTNDGDLIIHPVNHATLALGWKKLVIYVDPVGGATRFAGLPRADLVLLTDIHGDHLNVDTIQLAATEKAPLIAPPRSVAPL